MKKTKHPLAKIFATLPFAVYLLGVLLVTSDNLDLFAATIIVFYFGWLVALPSSVCGIVFHFLLPKEIRQRRYLIISVVNCVLSLAWMIYFLWWQSLPDWPEGCFY